MGLIKPDFSESQDTIGPGTYKVRVVDAKLGEWAGKDGKPSTAYINWSLETFGEENTKNNGRRIFHKTPIAGKGVFRLQQFYRAAMKQDATGEFDTEMLYGKELVVTVIDGMDREGNPTGYTEIKSVKPI